MVMDLRARNVPQEWFVALEHGSVWLKPGEAKPVNVVIWTDRTPEWLGTNDDQQTPVRKPLIDISGYGDRFGDQYFPVGGFSALVHAVRDVTFNIDMQGTSEREKPFQVVGKLSPATGVVPIAVHNHRSLGYPPSGTDTNRRKWCHQPANTLHPRPTRPL